MTLALSTAVLRARKVPLASWRATTGTRRTTSTATLTGLGASLAGGSDFLPQASTEAASNTNHALLFMIVLTA
jgi:hypothetical protein